MRHIEDENIFTCCGWMRNQLGLKGTSLIVYSIIWTYTQCSRESYFSEGQEFLADWVGVDSRTIRKILAELKEKSLISQEDTMFGNSIYRTIAKSSGRAENISGRAENISDDARACVIDNIKDNLSINNNILKDSTNNIKNNLEEEKSKKEEEIFDEFRRAYLGTKRGLKTEFENFKRKKNWREVLPILLTSYQEQIKIKDDARKMGIFVAQEKNLSTYINQSCWEEDLTGLQKQIEDGKGNIGYSTKRGYSRQQYGNAWEAVDRAINSGEDII